MTSRRGFLIASGAAVVGAALRPGLVGAQAPPPPVPGKDTLIVRSPRPINLEARLGDLVSYQTPEKAFFVRNNLDAPSIDAARWSLRVEGEVDNPIMLGLDDLRRLPMVTHDVLLECAGNGRSFHQPRASGIQWTHGAVGNARWRGVRLHDVLALAKPRPRRSTSPSTGPIARPRRRARHAASADAWLGARHALPDVPQRGDRVQQRFGPEGWSDTLDRMIKYGAPIPPEDKQRLLAYLLRHFRDPAGR